MTNPHTPKTISKGPSIARIKTVLKKLAKPAVFELLQEQPFYLFAFDLMERENALVPVLSFKSPAVEQAFEVHLPEIPMGGAHQLNLAHVLEHLPIREQDLAKAHAELWKLLNETTKTNRKNPSKKDSKPGQTRSKKSSKPSKAQATVPSPEDHPRTRKAGRRSEDRYAGRGK